MNTIHLIKTVSKPSLKTLLALAATSLTLTQANATTADRQLREWQAEVKAETQTLHAKFKLTAARKLQEKAFTKGGVVWAKRYTSAWGGWVYTDWDVAKRFHTHTANTLKKSIMQLNQRKPLSDATMTRHREMMIAFRTQNSRIHQLLNARIALNVHRGLEMDASNDAYQKYLAANIAGAKKVAALYKAKADYHTRLANQWASKGGAASNLIRQIGYQKKIDPLKFDKAYQHIKKLAKSGDLNTTTERSTAGR